MGIVHYGDAKNVVICNGENNFIKNKNMALLIIKIVLIILMIRVIVLSVGHLIVIFYNEATKMAIEQITKDPEDYVRTDHICKFMYNMIWVVVFIKLLYAAFYGHIDINI